MSVDRLTRVNALLKRAIGSFLFRILDEGDLDLTAVTITRVAVSKDLREARVFVSIRDHQAERRKMLDILRRRRGEIQAHISETIILKYTPRLAFELDTSLEEGDHVLNLLAKLEAAAPAAAPDLEPNNEI